MLKMFISYSHKDEVLRDGLETHFSLLKKQGIIKVWYDRKIEAGSKFARSIDENLADSNLILLLISPDFIDSEYCYGIEMKQAMKMHEEKIARVIPIILRRCDWDSAPFGGLTALPKDGKPIKSWPDIDDAFYDVTRGIRTIAENAQHPLESAKTDTAISPNKVICTRCGATAGQKTTCVGSYTHHEFKSLGRFGAFCRRCGASAGERSTCTGSYASHEFVDAGPAPTYCTRCGASAGERSVCTGSYTQHDFRVFG